jgi:tetratricopeptide (TPR) repeat protein
VVLKHLIIDPDFAQHAYALLCLLDIQRGDLKKADQALTAASDLLSDQASLLVAAAYIDLFLHEDPLQAKKRLAQALTRQPTYPPAHYNMALLHEHWLGERAAAQTHYQAYLEHQHTDTPYLQDAKEALNRLAQLENTAISSDPVLAKQWLLKGSTAYNQKKYQQAIDYFNQAINADPQAESSHYNLALAYYHLKAYASAEMAFEAVLEINPAFADAHYMLTITLIQAKKLDEAEAAATVLASLDAKRGENMLRIISKAR